MAEMSAERLLMSAADSMGNRSIGPVAKELRALAERAGLTQDQAAAGLADGSIKSTNKTMMNAIRGAITSAVNYTADALTIPEQYIPPELRGKGKQLADIAAAVSPGVDFQDMIKGSANMMNAQTPGEAAKGGAEMLIGMAGQAPGFGDAFALAAKSALPAIFAGVGAKTMDAAKYARAEDMHRAGASRNDIWNETGWFKGGDGKWRFEIDDSTAHMKGTGSAGDLIAKRGNTLQANMYHPDLYDAYPSAGMDWFKAGDVGQSRGAYSHSVGDSSRGSINLREDLTGQEVRSTTLHEAQHGVQAREGFARGGSSADLEPMRELQDMGAGQMAAIYRADPAFKDAVQAWEDMGSRLEGRFGPNWYDEAPDINLAEYENLSEAVRGNPAFDSWESLNEMRSASPFDGYRHLAGEVEARNVQTRQNLSASQRQATPPWQTQDIPDSAQVFRTGNRGPQGSQSLLDYLAQQKMTAEY
jgi:hypothetical protein